MTRCSERTLTSANSYLSHHAAIPSGTQRQNDYRPGSSRLGCPPIRLWPYGIWFFPRRKPRIRIQKSLPFGVWKNPFRTFKEETFLLLFSSHTRSMAAGAAMASRILLAMSAGNLSFRP